MNTPLERATVGSGEAGWRADRALGAVAPRLTRRMAKRLFQARLIRLNGRTATGAEPVREGDVLEYPAPASEAESEAAPQVQDRLPRLTTPHGRHLLRLYEDESVVIISKPSEIPVHRGEGGLTRRDTLDDVFEKVYPPPVQSFTNRSKSAEPQAGDDDSDEVEGARSKARLQGYYFVHRLDMETSGCLVVAKNAIARDTLIRAFSERRVYKEYLAIVVGEVPWNELTVDKAITYVRQDEEIPWGKRRIRGLKKGFAVPSGSGEGKASQTHFQVVERFSGYTLLRVQPRTGRTHQIRVHLVSTRFPLAYDPLYGRRGPLRYREFDLRSSETERGESIVLNRLPLHAHRITVPHPLTGEPLSAEAPLPSDLKTFLGVLRKFRKKKDAH